MHYENNKSGSIFIGGCLSLCSGLLFTINRAINDRLDLNFVDTLLMVFTFRSIFFLVVICCQSSTGITSKDSKEDQEENLWWINSVDEGKNIYLVRLFLILQGVFGGTNNLGAFLSVTLMPIGDAHALIFSAPLPTMILSKLIFGTRMKIYKFLCGICVFTGIILISKPSYIFGNEQYIQNLNIAFNETFIHQEEYEKDALSNNWRYNGTYIYGVCAALLASFSRGCQATAISYLHKNKSSKSANLIGLYSGLGGMIIPVIAFLFKMEQFIEFNQNMDSIKSIGLICIGIFSALGTYMLIKSIEIIGSVLESFFRTSDIIVAYIIQITMFHQEINLISFLGSGMIIASIMLMAVEKTIIEKVPIQFVRNIL